MSIVLKDFIDLTTYTRASSGTFVGSNGLVQTAAVDVPRFEHAPLTGARQGLLIEESKTNAITSARDLTGSPWSIGNAGGTLTKTATGIDGAANAATRWIENTAEAEGRRVLTAVAVTSGTQYAASFVVRRAAGARFFQILFPSAAFGANVTASFNFDTGAAAVLAAGTATAAGMIDLGDGWYLCWLTSEATSSSTPGIQARMASNAVDVSTTYTGDGTSGLILDGAQFEPGFRPTSRIFTAGSTVTRAADSATVDATDWVAAGQGTLIAVGRRLRGGVATIANLGIGTIGSANIISLRQQADGRGQAVVTTGGTQQANITNVGTSPAEGAPFALGMAYNSSRFAVCLNGAAATVATGSYSIAAVDALRIGGVNASFQPWNGSIGQVLYYPTVLSDADIQAITASLAGV